MNQRIYALGLLLIVSGGFLLLAYGKIYLNTMLVIVGLTSMSIGFILGLLGVFIPVEKERKVWLVVLTSLAVSIIAEAFFLSIGLAPTIFSIPTLYILSAFILIAIVFISEYVLAR